jgi:hypothetical protein
MPVVQRQEERQDDRAAEAVLNQRKTFGENFCNKMSHCDFVFLTFNKMLLRLI